MEAFNQTNVNKLQQTAHAVIKYTFSIQLIAFILLSLWWMATGEHYQESIFRAFFHVSMAFNNAGFMLFSLDSSIFHHDAITVLITTFALMIVVLRFLLITY